MLKIKKSEGAESPGTSRLRVGEAYSISPPRPIKRVALDEARILRALAMSEHVRDAAAQGVLGSLTELSEWTCGEAALSRRLADLRERCLIDSTNNVIETLVRVEYGLDGRAALVNLLPLYREKLHQGALHGHEDQKCCLYLGQPQEHTPGTVEGVHGEEVVAASDPPSLACRQAQGTRPQPRNPMKIKRWPSYKLLLARVTQAALFYAPNLEEDLKISAKQAMQVSGVILGNINPCDYRRAQLLDRGVARGFRWPLDHYRRKLYAVEEILDGCEVEPVCLNGLVVFEYVNRGDTESKTVAYEPFLGAFFLASARQLHEFAQSGEYSEEE